MTKLFQGLEENFPEHMKDCKPFLLVLYSRIFAKINKRTFVYFFYYKNHREISKI